MIKKNSLPLICLLAFTLSGCIFYDGSALCPPRSHYVDEANYRTEKVKVYRTFYEYDKTIDIRFYNDTPNIPYINVIDYFREFFKTGLTVSTDGDVTRYWHPGGGTMSFNPRKNTIYLHDIDDFNYHPDFDYENSKTFLEYKDPKITSGIDKVIDLSSYHIDIHSTSSGLIYAPLTLLSCFAGGLSLIQTAWNGESIYVCDCYGSLTGGTRGPYYFKDTYFNVLSDIATKRPQDMIEYSYNQLCMMFDNDRGYTSQLLFGDTNLISMGLNGLLETFYPSIKAHLLSEDKATYYKGFHELFMGLFDGGHTTPLLYTEIENPYVEGNDYTGYTNIVSACLEDPLLAPLAEEYIHRSEANNVTEPYENALSAAFGDMTKRNGFYYYYDETHATSYIGFDSFFVDYEQWDAFYAGTKEQTPRDTYGFVRDSMYQALEDGATNVVLDMTCNGGGDTGALMGLLGLFDKAIGHQTLTNTLNKSSVTENYGVDINLDGIWDEVDVLQAARFEALNIGVLTSSYCFSAGNTFPSEMKKLGYKTLGTKTSGGSCAITFEFTGDGLPYLRSSHCMIGTGVNGKNLDDGVTPDYDIPAEMAKALNVDELSLSEAAPYFYDVELISNYLESAYAEEE